MTALGRSVAFALFIGAARADADPGQVARLRAEIPPLLETFRADGQPRPVLEHVIEIMGAEWRPSPEWRQWIDAMLVPEEGS